MTVDRVLIDVNPLAWRIFCQGARREELEVSVRLGGLVESIVRKELQAEKARRQREFRAKQRAARDR